MNSILCVWLTCFYTSFIFTRALSTTDLLQRGQDILNATANNNYSAPYYFQKLGTEGVNYDVDERGRPYIWCEKYVLNECLAKPDTKCGSRVKCYAERKSNQLGCMAVLVYDVNAEPDLSNDTVVETAPILKGCWTQDETELRECIDERECVVNTRKTGSPDRAAKFCCCRSHGCNNNFTVRPPPTENSPSHPTNVTVAERHWLPTFVLSNGGFNLLFILLLCACIGAVVGITYWNIRKRRQKHFKYCIKPISNGVSLGSVENGQRESRVLLSNKSENVRDITLHEKMSTGRFSEVYKGKLGNNYLAVKIFPPTDLDSWVNEQDVYALKAVRSHPHIVNFVAAFQKEAARYWLVTVYHDHGSLNDYLKENVLSVDLALKFISTMLNGLAFLHEEIVVGDEQKPAIVHRDFKSKNVLIKEDLSTCITDFGLALKCENGRMSEESHGQVGTRRYMSPEVLEGATEFSAFAFQQIDVYAAALVLWEILSRTNIPEEDEDVVSDFQLPYEHEVGLSPSLGQIRDLVVVQKGRPKIRECVRRNKITSAVAKTMTEMWDMEPDGRITSGCARDRMLRLYDSISVLSQEAMTNSLSNLEDL